MSNVPLREKLAEVPFSAIVEQLTSRNKLVEIITREADGYIKIAKETIQSTNASEYETFDAALKSIKAEVAAIDKALAADVEPAKSLEMFSRVYDSFGVIDERLGMMVKIINNPMYERMAKFQMSITYYTTMMGHADEINKGHQNYINRAINGDDTIAYSISKFIEVRTHPDNVYMYIRENVKDNVNKLMMKIIAELINALAGDKRRYLEALIEKFKNNVLGATRFDMSKYHGTQWQLSTYGLAPTGVSTPLRELFTKLHVTYDDKSTLHENLEALGRALNVGVIFIPRVSGSPIEYNLRGIIDPVYISTRGLKVTPGMGLNKQILEKYATIVDIKPVEGATDDLTPIIVRGKGDPSDVYLIFDTIVKPAGGNTMARLLGRGSSFKIPAGTITGLLEGLSSRPHAYNEIICDEVIVNAFDISATAILRQYEQTKAIVVSPEPVMNAVRNQLLEKFSNGQIPKSRAELLGYVIDPDIPTIIASEIIRVLPIPKSAETTMSYLARFDLITRTFIKELEKQWFAQKLPVSMFKDNTDLKNTLYHIHKQCIEKASSELIRMKMFSDLDISLKGHFIRAKELKI